MLGIGRISIYYKIIITFLLVIIPLYALSMYINELSADALRKELLASMTSRVHFYKDSLERELDNIYSLQNNLALDSKFQRFGVSAHYISSIERTDLIMDMQRQLRLIQSSNQLIREVQVHFLDQNTTITANVLYAKLQTEAVLPLLYTSQEEALLHLDGKLYLRMTYPQSLKLLGEGQAPLFLIVTEISTDALRDTLSQFSLNAPEVVSLTNTAEDWLITNQTNGMDSDSHSEPYISVSEMSDTYQFLLKSYALEDDIIRPVSYFRSWLWWLSFITLLIVLLFSYSINKMLQQPFKTLIRSFRKVEAGHFEVRVEHKVRDEFHFLYSRFNQMISQINHLIKTVYEQRIRTQQAEMKHLQSQINPHFLYNSLFVLHQMVQMQDYDNLEHFSKNLSDYFRMITRNAMQEVTLDEEFNFAQNYVSIQEFRFSNRVRISFDDIPEEVRMLKVPRLILQPVIENAFQHGMKDRIAGGLIHIRFRLEAGILRIAVEDNGAGIVGERFDSLTRKLTLHNSEWNQYESTGLINVHQRLVHQFGPSAGIDIEPGQVGGVTVRLNIPVEEAEQHVDVSSTGS